MRRFPSSWDKTLAALGFKRRVDRARKERYTRKRSRIETLETRAMLAADWLQEFASTGDDDNSRVVISGTAGDDTIVVGPLEVDGVGVVPAASLGGEVVALQRIPALIEVNAGDGDDTITVSLGKHAAILRGEGGNDTFDSYLSGYSPFGKGFGDGKSTTFDGGAGDDTYVIDSSGADYYSSPYVSIIDSAGIDTLDFSRWAFSGYGAPGVQIELGSAVVQNIDKTVELGEQEGGADFAFLLQLDPSVGLIERAIGSPYGDTIIGNDADNYIDGNGGGHTAYEILDGGAGDDVLRIQESEEQAQIAVVGGAGRDLLDLSQHPQNATFSSAGFARLGFDRVDLHGFEAILGTLTTDVIIGSGPGTIVIGAGPASSDNLTNTGGAVFQGSELNGVLRDGEPLIVTTAEDESDVIASGADLADLSLREALALAAMLPQRQTITFDASLHGETITLADLNGDGPTDSLLIDDDVTIVGPGADLLTIDAAGAFAGFDVSSGAEASISDLTVRGASIGLQVVGSDATLRQLEIVSNSTGVYMNSGSVTIVDSTIAENAAGVLMWGGSLDARNTTFSGNNSRGMQIGSGDATLINTTIVGSQIGVDATSLSPFNGPTVTMQNSIVAGNSLEDIRGGAADYSASSHVLYGVAGSGVTLTGPGIQQVADLAAAGVDSTLADNGGPTRTHALLPDSPAIDAGDNALADGIDNDQRGGINDRILGGVADLGAYESAIHNTGASLEIYGRESDDEIVVTADEVYLHGLEGDATPYDAGGLPVTVRGGAGDDVITVLSEIVNLTVYGDGGDDQLFGSSAGEKLYGGAGDDELFGRGGRDFLFGEGGSDALYGGSDVDALFGGDQSDSLYGGGGQDSLSGEAGEDLLEGGADFDWLHGGDGNDTLFDGGDGDLLKGDSGDDTFVVEQAEGTTSVLADGADTLDFSTWSEGVNVNLGQRNSQVAINAAGTASLTIYGIDSIVGLIGTSASDTLVGDSSANRIEGRGGDDILSGAGGDDELFGGAGNDELFAYGGASTLDGGYGDDEYLVTDAYGDSTIAIFDADGTDILKADSGWLGESGVAIDLSEAEPQIVSNEVATVAVDLPGNDSIENVSGTSGPDVLRGGEGVNRIEGLAGDDTLVAGPEDVVLGGEGVDSIEARSGLDAVFYDAGGVPQPPPLSDTLGFNGEQRSLASGYAEWTFDSLPAGDYLVSATWNAADEGSTTVADYELYVGATPALVATLAGVDQSVAPEGQTLAGRTWRPLGDAVRVGVGESITVRVAASSGASAALVDAVAVTRQVYALDAQVSLGGSPVTEWEDVAGAYPAVELSAARANDGSAISIAAIQPLGPLADDVIVDETAGVWSASLSPSAGLADGSYPITFRFVDTTGGVGNATLLAVVGAANSAPTLVGLPTALSATEHVEASFAFTVDDLGGDPADLRFDFGPGTPASLIAAHAAAPAITKVAGGFRFAWTPTEDDDGDHQIHLRVRDSGETPIQHSVTIPVTVAEVDEPAYVDAVSFGFAYAETATGERVDPSVVATVKNDGPLEGVRVLVDWTYEPSFDGSTFAPYETFLLDDFAALSDKSRTLVLSPTYSQYLGDKPWSSTTVAVKVQELDPATGEYRAEQHVVTPPGGGSATVDRLHVTGSYTPVDTANASINGFGLKAPSAPGESTDLTVVGVFANPDGPVEGIEINFFRAEAAPGVDDFWLGVAVTDDTGAFEFTPRDAVDLSDFSQDQTVTIRAEAYDPIPTTPPPAPGDTAGLAVASSAVTLKVPTLPKIVGLTYDDTPWLEGYGVVRQPRITGQLTPSPTHDDVAEVVIGFDLTGNGVVDGISITEADGSFEYYPESLTDSANDTVTAWAVIWDEFRRLEIPHSLADETETTVAFDVGDPSTTFAPPTITGFALEHGPGPEAYLPTVQGQVNDADGGGLADVVVEFSVVASGSGAAPFEEHYAEVATDEGGAFRFTPYDLEVGETYAIHARVVGWDPVAMALVVGPTSVIDTVTIVGDPPAPELLDLRIAYDTGALDDDGETSDPTLTGTVQFAGDPSVIEVEFDLDGDGMADAVALPDDNGTFFYTPTGLSAGETITVTAWAVVPDDGATPPTLDPALSVDGFAPTPADAWSGDDTEAAAEAWFDELFAGDEFDGDWYNADFTPDTDGRVTSTPRTASVTLTPATDPSVPNGQLSIVDLGRPTPTTAHDPTLKGRVVSDGSVEELLLEFAFVSTVDGVEVERADGEAWTEADGSFLYTPQEHSITSNHLRVKVHEPIYGSTETRVTVLDFADPYAAAPLSTDPALAALTLTLDTPEDERVVFTGRVTEGDDLGLAGRTVQLDLNGDGRQDGLAFTDAFGRFEYTPEKWVGPTTGVLTVRARVTGEGWNDDTLTTYQTLGEWSEVLWTPPANDPPSVLRLELANDTGYYDFGGDGAIDATDYEYRVLDRVTSDPTIAGQVADAPHNAVVEFSHRGDGVVDGTATTDETGAFLYRPEGLDYGYWDLHARVRENDPFQNDPVTGQTLDSGWQPITASGEPTDPTASATGFTLVAPSAATVADVRLANPADPGPMQYDPRLKVTVHETDSIENVVVDFYEQDAASTQTYLGSSRLDADGTATFTPLGIKTGEARTILAVPREEDPTTGQDLVGAPFTFNAGVSVVFQEESDLKASFPGWLYVGALRDFSATVFADVKTKTANLGGIDVDLVSPQYVEVRVTHWSTTEGAVVESLVEQTPVVAQQRVLGSGEGTYVEPVYRYSYTPDMGRWADAVAAGDELRLYARAVGFDEFGSLVLGRWTPSAQIISDANYRVESRQELAVSLQLNEPLTPDDEGELDATTTSQSTSPRVLGSVSQSLADEVGGQDWRESIAVTERRVEFDYYVDGAPDGIVDLAVPIDDPNNFEAELAGLDFGVAQVRARLVEEIQIDHEFVTQNSDGAINDSDAYRDELEAGETTRVTGQWQKIQFTLVDPAPMVVEGSLALEDPEPTSSGHPGSVAPIVTGSIASSIPEDLGGFLVEFDHNGDSFADGTAFTYEDGSFDYEPLGLAHGETTLRVRASDLYGADGAAYGQWVDFVFEYLPVPAPTLDGAPALETTDGLTADGTPRSLTPVIVGAVDAHEAMTDLTVEVDYDNDGTADGSAAVDLQDGSYRFADATTPYGDVAPRIRPVGYHGAERVEGVWSDPLAFFHASADAPVLTFELQDATTGEFSGRATVGGYGVTTLVEVVVVDGGGVENTSFVTADRNGAFTVIPPRISNGAQEVRVRGVERGSAAASIVGEWNRIDLTSQPLSLAAPGTASIDQFAIAYPIAGNASVADPTIEGRLAGDVSTATVEFDYDDDGVANAEVSVAADGSFRHTPVGLTPNSPYSIRARWKQWDPAAGAPRVSDTQSSGWDEAAAVSVTHDPTLAAAPYVDELSLDPPSALGTTRATFSGKVQGDIRLGGLTVWFDEDGDGVAEGSATTLDNGEFIYLSTTIQPSAGDQQITAWVDPPDYLDAAPAPAFQLTFQLAVTPSIVTMTSTEGAVSGLVEWTAPASTVVEYYFVGEEPGAAPTAPTPQDLSTAPEALDFLTTTPDAEGLFELDATAHVGAAVTLYARARSGEQAGAWRRLTLGVAPNSTAPLPQDVGLAYDTGANDADGISNDPTIRGRLGLPGEGAFGVVEYEIRATASGPYAPGGRATADARGEFRFTPEAAPWFNEVRVRSLAWDAALEQEVYSDWVEYDYLLVSDANPAVLSLAWAQAPVGDQVSDATVVGTVSGLGRKAGVRVEFSHGPGETVDGIAYTDALGNFTYTPLGLTGSQSTTLTITARAVAWNEQQQRYERDDFTGADTASKKSINATHTEDSPTEIALGGESLVDLSNDALALAGFEDAVFSAIAHAGLAGAAAGTIAAPIGDFLLLHRGGGEGQNEFDEAVFTAAALRPNDATYDTGYIDLPLDYVTDAGGRLIGALQTVVDVSSSGDTTLVDDFRFRLRIDDYQIAASSLDSDTAGDTGAQTALTLTGEYEFVLTTAGAHALYSGHTLLDAPHFVDEIVDYDYLVTESAFRDEPAASGGAPTASDYAATGGSEYHFQIGVEADGAQPAVPAQYQAGAPYTAPLHHTEVSRGDGAGDGSGGASTTSVSGSESSDRDGDATVTTTYVETVTKTGSFNGADSATGTITVSIQETREETSTDTRVVQTDSEQSSETTHSTESYTRDYTGTATYTSGVSIEGSATITETRGSTILIVGAGSSAVGLRIETWNYSGSTESSSTLTATGTFFESLDPNAQQDTSDVAGTYYATVDTEWDGAGTTNVILPPNQNGERSESSGTYYSTNSATLDETFRIETRDRRRQAEGEYTIASSGNNRETVDGTFEDGLVDGAPPTSPINPGVPVGDYTKVDFRNVTTGSASGTTTTAYLAVEGSVEGDATRETTEHSASARGGSRTATQSLGWSDDSGDTVAFTDRTATSARVTFDSDGTTVTGYGLLDGAETDSSRDGVTLETTQTNAVSFSEAIWVGGVSQTLRTNDEAIAQLYTYEGDDVSGAYRRSFNATVRTSGSASGVGYSSKSGSERSDSERSAFSLSGGDRSSSGSYEQSDSGSSGSSSSSRDSGPGSSTWGKLSTSSSRSTKSSGSYSGGDYRHDSEANRSASSKSSGGSSSSGDGASSSSNGSTRASERTNSNSSSSAGRSDSSSNRKGSGSSNGSGHSASSSHADGVTTVRGSGGSSKSNGGSEVSTNSGSGGSQKVNSSEDGGGSSNWRDRIAQFGGGAGFRVMSAGSGGGSGKGSGSASLSPDGDVSIDSSFAERSGGRSSSDWSQWSNTGLGSSRSWGDSATRASLSGSGQFDGGGLDGSASEFGGGRSDANGSSFQASFGPDWFSLTSTRSSENARGGSGRKVEVSDGEATGGDASIRDGGSTTVSTTRVTIGLGGSSNRSTTYTATSNNTEDSSGGTESLSWIGGSENSSSSYTFESGASGWKSESIRSSSTSDYSGRNTESVSHSADRSSGSTSSESWSSLSGWTYTREESEDSLLDTTHVTTDQEWWFNDSSRSSSYDASHGNGRYGAVGGVFSASNTYDRTSGRDTSKTASSTEEDSSTRRTSSGSFSSSLVGVYQDTASGRQESGVYLSRDSRQTRATAKGQRLGNSSMWWEDNSRNGSSTSVIVGGAYSPFGSSSYGSYRTSAWANSWNNGTKLAGDEAGNEVGSNKQGWSRNTNGKISYGRTENSWNDFEPEQEDPDPVHESHGQSVKKTSEGGGQQAGSESLGVKSHSAPRGEARSWAGFAWDSVKLWDNDDVGTNYGNLRAEGRGQLESAWLALGASVGQQMGVGDLESARSGRDAEGNRLSAGERLGSAAAGSLGVLANAVPGAGRGAKALKELGEAAIGASAKAAKFGGKGATKVAPKQGIYEFPDQAAGGKPYVGQSGNVSNRLKRHEAAGRLKPGTEATTPVPGGKTAREIAEHKRIQELTGGQRAKASDAVSNKLDPIGPGRRPDLGLPDPTD